MVSYPSDALASAPERPHFGSRWPLRARIIAALTGVLSMAMLTVGLYSSWQLREHLLTREDAELRAAAPTLADSTIQQEQANAGQPRVPSIVPTNVYAVRIVGQRTRDFVPATGPRPDFGRVDVESAKARAGQPYTVDSQTTPDHQWRVIQGIDENSGEPYAVAISLDNMQNVVRQMQLLTIVVSSVTLLAAIGMGLLGVRRALRPLSDIEDTAAAIASGDLSRRVPNPGSRDEVQSLSESLNAMLTQLEQLVDVKDRSEESMRRFVADASHELRTPLATVRGYSELYRQGAMTRPEDVQAGFRRIENEANRMSAMVDDLLLLSRIEAEQRASAGTAATRTQEMGEVDLTVLAGDAVADAGARAKTDEEKQRFRVKGIDGSLSTVIVRGDEQRLRQVVTNLLTNAVRYTPAGSPIEVCVGHQGEEALLRVVDHGPGIPSDVRGQVFNRFFRVDAARNRAEGSTGLGLSIVAAIVKGHSGTAQVLETSGGGATFEIRLPLVSAPPPCEDDESFAE